MFIAKYQDEYINAIIFLERFGANFKEHKRKNIVAKCPSCDCDLTLCAASSDTITTHFSHSKQNTNCPIVNANKRKILHLSKFEKHPISNLKLRHKIANDNELLLNIYIRCNVLSNWESDKGNLSVDQFCQLLILSVEANIWRLKEMSIITLPYILVQLSDYPIQVARYDIQKTDKNQFRFILSQKDKRDKTKAFTNYFLHKNTLTGDFIKGCNIPTPPVEKVTQSTIDFFRKNIGDKLFKAAPKILF